MTKEELIKKNTELENELTLLKKQVPYWERLLSKIEGDYVIWQESITLVNDNKSCHIYNDIENKPLTLADVLKLAKDKVGYSGNGILLCICESYLSGLIFRYGNYCDDNWYLVGIMAGFA